MTDERFLHQRRCVRSHILKHGFFSGGVVHCVLVLPRLHGVLQPVSEHDEDLLVDAVDVVPDFLEIHDNLRVLKVF